MFMYSKKALILFVGVWLWLVSAAIPPALLAVETGGSLPGMASFTDSSASHVYAAGESIGFKIGPFPCQANKQDRLVFGIMERSGGEFLTQTPPLAGLQSSTLGYYLDSTADADGYFMVTGQINTGVQQNGVLAVKIYNQDGQLLVNEQTGAEAFIPIVGADGTPAIIIGSIQEQAPTDTTLTGSWVKAIDDDLDHCYFDNQAVQLRYTIPGGMPLPSNLQSMITVVPGIFSSNQDFISSPNPLKDISVQVTGNSITITAVINNPGNITLSTGVLGTSLVISSSLPGMSSLISSLETPMPAVSADGKACILGVAVPAQMLVTASPALSEIKNLYNTERPIAFTKGSQGSITFSPGLNIIDNRDELSALDQGIQVDFNQTEQSYAFQVTTSSLGFLQGKTAGLKAYGVMSQLQLPQEFRQEYLDQYIKMSVIDNSGQTVADQDINSYIDRANVVYNQNDDTLLIPVKHFTTYSIGRVSQPAQPDESAYSPWPGGIQQKTASWEPVIIFSQPVDAATLNGISIWKRLASGTLQNITANPQVQAGNSKAVEVKHSSAFASGSYLLLIDSTLKSTTETNGTQGQLLKQAVKYEFSI